MMENDKIEITFREVFDYIRDKDLEIYELREKCNRLKKLNLKYENVLDKMKHTSDIYNDNNIMYDYVVYKEEIDKLLGEIFNE